MEWPGSPSFHWENRKRILVGMLPHYCYWESYQKNSPDDWKRNPVAENAAGAAEGADVLRKLRAGFHKGLEMETQ